MATTASLEMGQAHRKAVAALGDATDAVYRLSQKMNAKEREKMKEATIAWGQASKALLDAWNSVGLEAK